MALVTMNAGLFVGALGTGEGGRPLRLPRWMVEWAYAAGVSLVALATIVGLAGLAVPTDELYAPMAIALLVGLLLTVRLLPNQPPGALVLLPAIVVDAHLGLAALPAVAYAGLLAGLVRGVRGPRVLSGASHLVLAYTAGHVLASLIPVVPTWLSFAFVFAAVRLGLWHLAARLDAAPSHPRAEHPEAILSLALAPISLLPILFGERLGDGALLLATAALLALLFIVREAANLATARAETEAERDRLARANALQDDLIHLITHELRNPLTLVMSYSQMARRAVADETYDAIPGYIAQVERSGRSIQRLVENLLQLSRLERSDGLPAPEPVTLGSIINHVVVDLGPLAKQKQQHVEVSVPPDLPPALAMPMLLREAISNLVSNAVKYTPEQGSVSIWCERGAEGRTLVVGVRDTGIGLSAEDQARLFTKFFRSSDPRVQRERGSGLGLALTHAMVERMGGRISVESALGQGTTFRLILPAG